MFIPTNKQTHNTWLFNIHTLFILHKKHDFFRGEDSMMKLSADLREHATKIINCGKEEMLTLTKKRKNYKGKFFLICEVNLMQIILRFNAIVIKQENAEVLHRLSVV